MLEKIKYKKTLITLIVLFITLNLIDIYITDINIERGAQELNDNILWRHFNVTGVQPIDYIKKVFLGAIIGAILYILFSVASRMKSSLMRKIIYILVIIMVLSYIYVIINNIQVYYIQKNILEKCLVENV